jgi:hypothetical protein
MLLTKILLVFHLKQWSFWPSVIVKPGNTKGGSIIVPLTSCLTGLDWSVLQIKTKIVSSHTADSKLVRQDCQWYSDTSPFSIPWLNSINII